MPSEADFYQYGYSKYNSTTDNRWGWGLMPECFGYNSENYKVDEMSVRKLYDQASKGFNQAYKDFLHPHVIPFMAGYRRFTEEYNVKVDTGCGCCGAGWYITIDNMTYEFDPGDFEND